MRTEGSFMHKNAEERIFYINEDITSKISELIFEILEINRKDKEEEESKKSYTREPIKLYISSYGGALDQMWALVDVILASKTPVHTISLGFAESAGFKIFISGHKRFVAKHTKLMYHQLSCGTSGKIMDMAEDVEQLVKGQNEIEKYVLEHTEIPPQMILEAREKKKDLFFTAEEAIKYKIADEILETL